LGVGSESSDAIRINLLLSFAANDAGIFSSMIVKATHFHRFEGEQKELSTTSLGLARRMPLTELASGLNKKEPSNEGGL